MYDDSARRDMLEVKERPFNSETFNQKCLDWKKALLKASGRKIHLLILIRLFTIYTSQRRNCNPNRSARWCGNWTCHWTMSKSKKSSNLLIETRQDQQQFQVDFYCLRLLLLHHVGCIEPGLVTSLSCVFEAFRQFLYPFNSRMASWPMRSIWSWWCWVFSVSSRQSRHQRGVWKNAAMLGNLEIHR